MKIRLRDYFNRHEAAVIRNVFSRYNIKTTTKKVKLKTDRGTRLYPSVFIEVDSFSKIIDMAKTKYDKNLNSGTKETYRMMIRFKRKLEKGMK